VRDREEGLPRSETHRTARCILHVDRDLQPRACTRAITVTCCVTETRTTVVQRFRSGVFLRIFYVSVFARYLRHQ